MEDSHKDDTLLSNIKASLIKVGKGDRERRQARPMLNVLKSRQKYNIVMMYVIGFFSGFLMITSYPASFYVQYKLEVDSIEMAWFNSIVLLSWSFKPIYGYISEFFFPFKYRIKSYIFASCVVILGFSVSLFLYTPKLHYFTVQYFMIYLSFGVVDMIGEGLTALIMKTDKEILMLSSFFDPNINTHIDNKRSFGNFYNFRALIRNLFNFLGGALAEFIDIKWIFLAVAILAIIIGVYTLFGFHEPRVT